MLKYDMRDDLNPGRITVAMWDFSWLSCHYPGGAFEDFDRVTDELLDRHFNTVRIDCFPGIIGLCGSREEYVTYAANPEGNWGLSAFDFKHNIAAELIEFMTVCKNKGIFVMLSTWNVNCVEYANLHDIYRKDRGMYFKAWEKTLDMLNERGLLENVLLVDLDQEFPYFSPYSRDIQDAGGTQSRDENESTDLSKRMEEAAKIIHLPGKPVWNQRQVETAYGYMKESLDHFHQKYPFLRFTFSLTSFWKEIRSSGIRDFDALELHLWIHDERFDSRTGFGSLDKKRSNEIDYSDYQQRVNMALKAVRPMLLHSLHKKLQYAMEWSEEISAPVITTEAWGPWWHMDHPDLTWGWLREWCAECNALAGEYGLWGTTPWNYAHPYWDNWKDIQWYRVVNDSFLKSK